MTDYHDERAKQERLKKAREAVEVAAKKVLDRSKSESTRGAELSDSSYLRELSERLGRIAAHQGVDGYDCDRLNRIATEIERPFVVRDVDLKPGEPEQTADERVRIHVEKIIINVLTKGEDN